MSYFFGRVVTFLPVMTYLTKTHNLSERIQGLLVDSYYNSGIFLIFEAQIV